MGVTTIRFEQFVKDYVDRWLRVNQTMRLEDQELTDDHKLDSFITGFTKQWEQTNNEHRKS